MIQAPRIMLNRLCALCHLIVPCCCTLAHILMDTGIAFEQTISGVSGTKTVQCGRRPDAMKFWLMWKARGHQGFAHLVDNALRLSK